ncbi:MAG: phosphoribosylaminoimidazole synthetase [Deltaproteobacteria bacterium SG8_13]|nr:MAG: phosphoribosylaminoimidazole synthetase [Deltaproteobacteria bacterium SG8_13]
MTKPMTYVDAGVDVEKANKLVETIKGIARQTHRSGVIGEIGGFGGLFSLNVANVDNPVLVSSTDGVGTKLKIAFLMNRHDTVGIDLVAMCVNDIVVQGAKPLFFLDYLAMGELNTTTAAEIVRGIGEGCLQAGCALIGGETAEMPGIYRPGEYDLAGFAVGMVDNSKILDGSAIHVGDRIIGIASNGLHSNGYSLVRKICFEAMKLSCDDHIPELGSTLGEELLRPTRIYAETIRQLVRDLPVRGLAHITGGGLVENLLRIIPRTCQVVLQKRSWEIPPIFSFLQKGGQVTDEEMMLAFNNGIGLVAVVPEDSTSEVLSRLETLGEKAFLIGEIAECRSEGKKCEWV